MNGNYMQLARKDDSDSGESDESYATVPEWKSDVKCAPLRKYELYAVTERQKSVVFIQKIDKHYHLALADIKLQSIISILLIPTSYGRHSNCSVFVIATANFVYVYDLKALGCIPPELVKVLELDYPKKIMHFSDRICDFLYKRYNIKPIGICDTSVEWCVAAHKRCNISLEEAISCMFSIPLNELTCAELEDMRTSKHDFTGRPLSADQLKYLAKIAILQQKLHHRLMFDNITWKLGDMSTKLSRSLLKMNNSYEAALAMCPTSTVGLDCIDINYKISTHMD